MKAEIGSEALIPNPALKRFAVLIGQWQTTGTHPQVHGKIFHGCTSFAWLEGGAFLMMRSEIDEPEIPSGLAIFGSDDAANEFFMLYFDERRISRKYNVDMTGNQLKWWRDDPKFSQRLTITIEDEGNKLVSKGEMSQNGAAWEEDLALTYARL